MNQPEWDPVVVVDKALRPSGPIPVCVVLSEPRDHAMSPLGLAPSLAAQRPETPGHGMEIPMTFWCAMRNMGPSFGSYAWIPMGARCGTLPTPNSRTSGHAKVRKAAGTVTREPDREFISPCAAYICLTRAFSWAHHNEASFPWRCSGITFFERDVTPPDNAAANCGAGVSHALWALTRPMIT